MSDIGWRLGFANVLAAIQAAGSLATALVNGTLRKEDFAKLATVADGELLGGYAFSAVVDMTATGLSVVMPPKPARVRFFASSFELKSVGATISPTFSIGSNAPNYNDLAASQTQVGFTNQAAETNVSPTVVSAGGLPYVDTTTNGIKLNVTGGATGGALTARLGFLAFLMPL